jgi:hypothetical protein
MKFISLFAILVFTSASYAVGIADFYDVAQVRVDKSGKGYVTFKQPLTDSRPTCLQTGYSTALAFDTNTAGGKSIMSVALAAQASGKKIYAVGSGNCEI